MKIFPATGILDPRQVDKTTLAKQIADEISHLYLDLENAADRKKLKESAFFSRAIL